MCGILGQSSLTTSPEYFNNILESFRYRGPDHSATLHEGNLHLGHNRLSILDLDPRSNQPFHTNDCTLSIIFNGEVYNYKEIRKSIDPSGQAFRTTSDTEVLLLSYQKWGVKCFDWFHGQFAFCIFDRANQKLIIARDRFGEKPLFYCEEPEAFTFGSEIGPVSSLIQGTPTVDYTAIIDYLHFGYVPAPKTIYSQVRKLKPGNYLEYSLDKKKITANEPFYKISLSYRHSGSLKDKLDQFSAICRQVGSEISVSDVSLGAFLSGGVDSSGAVAFLKQTNDSINTFSAGFDSQKFDESPYASLVASHLGVKNINRKVDYGDFVANYEKMINMYGEPHNDFSFIPTYLICKEAAKFHTVMISGDGADEIFCGYPRYSKLSRLDSVKYLSPLMKLASRGAHLLPPTSNFRRKALALSHPGDEMFFYIMCMNFTPELAKVVYGEDLKRLATQYHPADIVSGYLSEIKDETSLIQKQRYLDIKMTLGDDMLVKVDRASMANSIEVRPFYLHPLITDFALGLAPGELSSLKTEKFFLKKCLEAYLPKSILYRNKMGFTFPLKELILTSLRPFFDECIADLPEEIISRKAVQNLLNMHKAGDRDFAPQLNSLMALGLWLKKSKVTA